MYAREVDGRILTLAVKGELWQDSMVLYDQETWTHWSQLSGEAKMGPLKGKRLRPIPAIVTDWQSWRRLYPEGTVVSLRHRTREYTRQVYENPEGFVLGIAAGNKVKAWGFDELKRTPALNDQWGPEPVVILFDRTSGAARLYRRTIDSRVLTFRLAGDQFMDEQTGSTWEPITGRAKTGPLAGQHLVALPAIVAFRDAWVKFHPETVPSP